MLKKIKSILLISSVMLTSQTYAVKEEDANKIISDGTNQLSQDLIKVFGDNQSNKSQQKQTLPSKVEHLSRAISTFSANILANANNALSTTEAAASGEDSSANGVYAQGFMGGAKNKGNSKKSASGNSEFKGGTIGYQYSVADDFIVGGAFSMINLDWKTKAQGDVSKPYNFMDHKSSTNYYVGSLYMASKMDQFILNGLAFGGAGTGSAKLTSNESATNTALKDQKITEKEFAMADAINGKKAKVKDSVYGIQAGVGYEIVQDDHVITPSIGIKWLSLNSKATLTIKNNDKSTTLTNKSSGSVVNGSAELKYAYKIENGAMAITPSISLGANNNFSNTLKADSKKASVAQGPKTKFFTAFDISAKGENVDFGIGGKYEMAKKFNAYSAGVNVIAKF